MHILRLPFLPVVSSSPPIAWPLRNLVGAWSPILRVYLAGLLVVLSAWSVLGSLETPDTGTYVEPMVQLRSHGVYGVADPVPPHSILPSAHRVPGLAILLTPLWWAGLGPAGLSLALGLLNVILSPVLGVAAYLLGRSFSPAVGLLACFFTMIVPSTWYQGVHAMSDGAGAGLLWLALLLWTSAWTARRLVRPNPAWFLQVSASGAVLGLAVLTRTTAQLLIPALVVFGGLYLLRRGRRSLAVKYVLAFSLGSSLVLAPWLLRNQWVLGAPILDTIRGHALLWSNAPLVRILPSDQGERLIAKEHIIAQARNPGMIPYWNGESYALRHPVHVSNLMGSIAREAITNQPRAFLVIWSENLRRIWFETYSAYWSMEALPQRPAWQRLAQFLRPWIPSVDRKVQSAHLELHRLHTIMMAWLTPAGIILMVFWKRSRWLGAALLAVLLYLSMISAVVIGYDRMRPSLEPAAAIFAAVTLISGFRALAYGLSWGVGALQRGSGHSRPGLPGSAESDPRLSVGDK